MRHAKTKLILIMSLLLSSCVSYNYVNFERLEAGEINYPESVRRVGVVNNMPYFDFAGLDRNTLPPLEGNGKIAADTLANLLALADYFECSIDELGFYGAWEKVREFSAAVRTPAKCEICKKA